MSAPVRRSGYGLPHDTSADDLVPRLVAAADDLARLGLDALAEHAALLAAGLSYDDRGDVREVVHLALITPA